MGFPGVPSLPGFPGTGMPGFPGFPGSGAPRSSNEDQIAANLVELSVYGITTLYEKFEAPAAKTDGTDEMPKGMTPMDTPMPKDMGPMPKEGSPMPKDMGPMPKAGDAKESKETTPMPPKK